MVALTGLSPEVESLRREVERLTVLAVNDRGVLDAILNHSPHGILVSDAAGKLILQNRASERIWCGSATADTVEDWQRYRAFHPDGRPYGPGDWAMARCLSRGEIVDSHEVDIQRFDGTPGVLLGSCAPVYDERGIICGAVSVFADITPFKQLETALRMAHADSELLYRLIDAVVRADTVDEIYEHALDAVNQSLKTERASILLFDEAGVMRFRAWRGLSPEYRKAVDGHSPWTVDAADPMPLLIGDVETDPTMEAYRSVFRAEGIRALGFFPLVHRRHLLGKFMVYSRTPREFSAHEVRLATAIASHVAQGVARRTSELEVASLLARSIASQRTAEQAVRARDELLSIVSHDLRNPVSTLSLSATWLLRLAADQKDERLRLQAQRIQRSLSTMEHLIGDLLDVGAIEGGALKVNLQDDDLGQIVDHALDLLRPLASERDQELTVDVPAGIRVRGDRERLTQVLSNIVGNAIKFTPIGGWIRIQGRIVDGSMVEMNVSDSGSGIAPEHLPRIFERFWRGTRPQRGGVGLGLAIAKGVVEAHGGTIWAESPPGAGAIFRFTLPLT